MITYVPAKSYYIHIVWREGHRYNSNTGGSKFKVKTYYLSCIQNVDKWKKKNCNLNKICKCIYLHAYIVFLFLSVVYNFFFFTFHHTERILYKNTKSLSKLKTLRTQACVVDLSRLRWKKVSIHWERPSQDTFQVCWTNVLTECRPAYRIR